MANSTNPILGTSANWKTTLWGNIAAVGSWFTTIMMALFAASQNADMAPDYMRFLLGAIPDQYKFWFVLLGSFITLFARNRFSYNAKDKDVSGGSLIQDEENKVVMIQSNLNKIKEQITKAPRD